VVFGKASGSSIELSAIEAGQGGFVINGMNVDDRSGSAVSSAGDLNGDGLDDLLVASGAATTGEGNKGKTFVVFGKADGSAINLAAIVAGNGGFVINGENNFDGAGASVSNAGDVNGDGFADLIVGAPGATPTPTTQSGGKAYVIYGGAASYTSGVVDFLGDSANNAFTGTNANETFIGGAGNDTLTGGGGKDVMYGGAGNDTFVLNASNIGHLASNSNGSSSIMKVDGGNGIDTFQLTDGANLDLTAVGASSRVNSIEKIDLRSDSAANTLTLALADVIDLTGMNLINSSTKTSGDWNWTGGTYNFGAIEQRHQLVIDGTSADTVVTSGGFTDTNQTAVMNGHTYEVYNHANSHVQLLIDQSINRSGVM
jgi:hypothetical protein